MKKIIYTLYLITFTTCLLSAQGRTGRIEIYDIRTDELDIDDIAPVLSGDGKKLFFVRGFLVDKGGKKTAASGYGDDQDIWMVTRENATDTVWSEPVRLEGEINNKDYNVVCGANYDGTELYVSFVERVKRKKDSTIYKRKFAFRPGISRLVDGKWTRPTRIDVKGLLGSIADGSYFYYSLSNDREHMFLSFMEIGSEDELENLYYSRRINDSTYSSPKLLEGVNSKGFETSPHLSKDGEHLYFASNRNAAPNFTGAAANDSAHIYIARRIGGRDDMLQWELDTSATGGPQNFLEQINAYNFDAYLFFDYNNTSIEEVAGVFSSHNHRNQKYKGHADLHGFYTVFDPVPIQVNTFDARTNEPLETTITIVDTKTNRKKVEKTNAVTYSQKDIDLGRYSILASAQGYSPELEALDVLTNEPEEPYVVNLYLKRGIRGIIEDDTLKKETVKIVYRPTPCDCADDNDSNNNTEILTEGYLSARSVFFKFARYDAVFVNPVTNPNPVISLRSFEDWLLNYRDNQLLLVGSADFIGTTGSNEILSQNRINFVKTYLARRGVETANILTLPLGERFDITDDQRGDNGPNILRQTEVERAANRQVTVYVITAGRNITQQQINSIADREKGKGLKNLLEAIGNDLGNNVDSLFSPSDK